MVKLCNKAKISLGSSNKKFLKSEQILHSILIRKFVVRKNLRKGEKFSFNNIKTALIYNKNGILPKDYYKIIGKKTKRQLKIGHIINWSDIR